MENPPFDSIRHHLQMILPFEYVFASWKINDFLGFPATNDGIGHSKLRLDYGCVVLLCMSRLSLTIHSSMSIEPLNIIALARPLLLVHWIPWLREIHVFLQLPCVSVKSPAGTGPLFPFPLDAPLDLSSSARRYRSTLGSIAQRRRRQPASPWTQGSSRSCFEKRWSDVIHAVVSIQLPKTPMNNVE